MSTLRCRPVDLVYRLVAVLAFVALAACGASDDGSSAASTTAASSETVTGDEPESPVTDPDVQLDDESRPETTVDVPPTDDSAEPGRIVALGEEFLLADLLALGVEPVASTATVPSAGFQGLGAFDTAAIEVLPIELNLEQLAALAPDVIVTTAFVVDRIGADLLSPIGELVVVPDDVDADERLEWLAVEFEASDRAEALLEELDRARSDLRAEIDRRDAPCIVSVATIYPGPSVAAWTDGSTDIPAAIVDAGCELRPDVTAGEPDRNGRLFLSPEQLGILDGPRLVLLQSDAVEGEREAVSVLDADPLWNTLPSVASGDVVNLDRLGYPGVVGQRALLEDLIDAL